MGVYIYRIKTKPKMIDGMAIHASEFAYKLHGWRENDANEKKIMGPTYRAWEAKGNPSVYFAHGDVADNAHVFHMDRTSGAYSDGRDFNPVGMIKADAKGRLHYFSNEAMAAKTAELVAEADRIDKLVKDNTAFKSLPDMFATHPGYRPSCSMDVPAMVEIADAYDKRAEAFGDLRRAYRYGGSKH